MYTPRVLVVLFWLISHSRRNCLRFVVSLCPPWIINYITHLQTYTGDGTDAFGYVGLDTVSERIVVAFKGTSDLKDWVSRNIVTLNLVL